MTREYEIINNETKNILNPTLVDIGAMGSIGVVAELLKFRNWNGLLYEPHPESYLKLVGWYKNNKQITIINKAVSDKKGMEDFYLHSSPHLSSLGSLYWSDKNIKIIQVEAVLLGEDLWGRSISKDFAFLKIDTEGYDYKILKNLLETSPYRPKLIMFENSLCKKNFNELLERYKYSLIEKIGSNSIYKEKE